MMKGLWGARLRGKVEVWRTRSKRLGVLWGMKGLKLEGLVLGLVLRLRWQWVLQQGLGLGKERLLD